MTSFTFKEQSVTLPEKKIKKGDKAPDFKVLDNKLNEVTLSKYNGCIKLISVVPSLDTGVCNDQTRRFNEDANELENVEVLTISMDLPFAQKRWCGNSGIDDVITLSDHRYASFGEAYGVLMEEMRLLCRAVFVVDSNDEVVYTEYVQEATDHPDYDGALEAARSAA
ncbi:thiol peroxidase [Halobacillus rhizosphaerae]|uniref:thiol peroxidase n=1 Tax=Halobacillus rhizosphaerae TaxID=3064889 RepID=UPI00398B5006